MTWRGLLQTAMFCAPRGGALIHIKTQVVLYLCCPSGCVGLRLKRYSRPEENGMRISWLFAGLCAAGIASAALAAEPSPYAGQQTQPIKALSQAETGDLLAGRGMG